MPIDDERVEEPPDPVGAVRGQANRTHDVVHPDRCPADTLVNDATEVAIDRCAKYRERPLSLERRRRPVDRIEAGLDRELGELLADRQVVSDQLIDRHAKRVSDPLRGEIERDDLCIDTPDSSTDLEGADPVIEEVAKQLGPCSTFRAGGIPGSRAAGTVISALGLRRVGDRRDRVPRIALVPNAERAR